MATSATIAFFIYVWQVTSYTVDFGVVALFSLVPLAAGLLGFVGVSQKRSVNRFSALNVASLFVFNMLMIAYLLSIILA
jgi:hypothetical protein